MHIVTDTGMDLFLPEEEMSDVEIHTVRHTIMLEDKTYRSGEDIESEELYRLLETAGAFPTTSQPAAGDFAQTYKKLAETDPDILSIHMSSGLSGCVNAAHAGAEMAPEANVTIVDTKTLSVAMGWQVGAAARALKAGWPMEKIVSLIHQIGAATESMYTLEDLKYLIHGGRISHMKGLIASILRIKPLIGVEKVGGTYEQLGQTRSFARAVKGLVELIAAKHPPESALRVQIGHAFNPKGVEMLREQIERVFDAKFLPMATLSPVLGAHTGPTMVGLAFAPQSVMSEVP